MTLKDLQHAPGSFDVRDVSSLPKVTGPVYLNVVEGTYQSDAESSVLLRDIGGSLALHEITRIFYIKMFQDSHLNKFVLNQEDPHACTLVSNKHPTSVEGSLFIQFIGHFIRIYELSAVRYAKESCQWSASTSNLESYHASAGNIMVDLWSPNEVTTYLAAGASAASAATDAKQA
ncbi:hypothetical protein CEUSTIGMA_g5825.t1 [Chlamydomonas eustigma]|uniref:Uncharacterized protein n=1 Tax=Chlamydomonas eustigma TaxID=1157962 RepID=A0A250X5N3_9CHLO|nr:hypothetical protein CEUSTIGMA_g5825.t1 [Chlamydomonas eustigma]|eukprot:GAX78383.1 hypothetical protein CEUSTIGMA_g5825.t1 [Chlamydomonas eustigma]